MSDQDKAREIACDQLGCHMAYYRDRNAHVFGCDNLTAIIAAALSDVRAQERERAWQPMDTAPKGSGDGNSDTTALGYDAPRRILLRFGEEGITVSYWDWYYAAGGHGCVDGFAWIEPHSGERLNLHYSTDPDGWMELPSSAVRASQDNQPET